MIKEHDIVCFVESKTDDIDIINFEGYQFNMKNRKPFAKVKSGGIIIGYKNELSSEITILQTDSKFVSWFKISSQLFNLDEDIVFGVVYIPP